MLTFAVGHTAGHDESKIIEELIQQCNEDLQGASPQAGLLVSADGQEHQIILNGLLKQWPDLQLIGCSTTGELSSKRSYDEDSIALMLFASDEIEICTGVGYNVSKDPIAATQQAVSDALAQCTKEPAFCITTPESLTTSLDTIITGINQSLEKSIPIVGGTASDNWKLNQTYQFYNNEVLSDSVPVLIFAGPVEVTHGVASGWTPLGSRKAPVTHVEGNVVYKIGERKALDFYKHYLGDHSAPSGEYPLAVFDNEETFYLRAPLSYDESAGSIFFAGDIPHGSLVQITEATRDDVINGVTESVQQASKELQDRTPLGALIFSCAARNDLLGTRTKEEIEIFNQNIGHDLPFIGFYGYGEISPFRTSSATRFHNETFITLLIMAKEH